MLPFSCSSFPLTPHLMPSFGKHFANSPSFYTSKHPQPHFSFPITFDFVMNPDNYGDQNQDDEREHNDWDGYANDYQYTSYQPGTSWPQDTQSSTSSYQLNIQPNAAPPQPFYQASYSDFQNSSQWSNDSLIYTQPSSLPAVSTSSTIYPQISSAYPAYNQYNMVPNYAHARPSGVYISPAGSSELMLSPCGSTSRLSPHVSPLNNFTRSMPSSPDTPGSQGHFPAPPSPAMEDSLLFSPNITPIPSSSTPAKILYTHQDQLKFFKDVVTLPSSPSYGPFVPQTMYRPHTNSDRRRYVEEVDLERPIEFWMDNPQQIGIPLADALHSKVKHLVKKDESVFEGRGPSVSIRLEWPGYRQWSRQIPTKDFRSPPGPITRAKLAKNVAKCVQRFISERASLPLDEGTDRRWRVGYSVNNIKLEDLVLVSMHHVSMGSWQPQIRLRRPL